MLFWVVPVAFKPAVIRPDKDSEAIFFTKLEFAIVGLVILVLKYPSAIHVVIFPVACIFLITSEILCHSTICRLQSHLESYLPTFRDTYCRLSKCRCRSLPLCPVDNSPRIRTGFQGFPLQSREVDRPANCLLLSRFFLSKLRSHSAYYSSKSLHSRINLDRWISQIHKPCRFAILQYIRRCPSTCAFLWHFFNSQSIPQYKSTPKNNWLFSLRLFIIQLWFQTSFW